MHILFKYRYAFFFFQCSFVDADPDGKVEVSNYRNPKRNKARFLREPLTNLSKHRRKIAWNLPVDCYLCFDSDTTINMSEKRDNCVISFDRRH